MPSLSVIPEVFQTSSEIVMIRPRRNRRTPAIRSMVRETTLSPADFILPMFLHEDEIDTPIASMPGVTRWSLKSLVREESLKTSDAAECFNPKGLVPRAIQALKKAYPSLCVITDVALDPYNTDGHDGLVRRNANGELVILNDETVDVLCQQALCHALAGADIVAPSDMMDGRVGALREALDDAGFTDVSIMSYTAKYASALYGPFRGALDSAPKDGDKKTYQMDPANGIEAMRETLLDEAEGADILMVKPASFYLDIISKMQENTTLPIAAYQVSGEYLMIKAASSGGWLDEKAVAMESLISIKRAGASMILTYFARQAAEWLKGQ
jgi:porphobilinogen synthase